MADELEEKKQESALPPAPAQQATDFITTVTQRFVSGVLSDEIHEPWRAHVRRLAFGGAGGLFYAMLKNYFGEGIGLIEVISMESAARAQAVAGYCIGGLMSVAVGGVCAWLSQMRSARLLFLVGMLSMQLFVGLIPGLKSAALENIHELLSIRSAYAQGGFEECVGPSAFDKGFKAFFGVKDKYDKVAVVVASGRSPADAQTKLNAIKAQDPGLNLRVGKRACDNNFYPVFASEYLSISEARPILERARKVVSDAYLSYGPLGN